MAFTLTATHLGRLCEQNAFPIPANEMVLFGLRGSTPVDPNQHTFSESRSLELATIDYTHPRCTIGQWRPADDRLAVFPGSTSPHKKYTAQGSKKANELICGLYQYVKGQHQPEDHDRWHDAFRQNSGESIPVLRTEDDTDYDAYDEIDPVSPRDHIHAGWCQSPQSNKHASAGCQVVVGYPHCAALHYKPNVGPWKDFIDQGYGSGQTRWTYVLLNGFDAQRVANSGGGPLSLRLRFGSVHPLVLEVQQRLVAENLFAGTLSSRFDIHTLRSVIVFQRKRFGKGAGDGIVGPLTASALGITSWPTV